MMKNLIFMAMAVLAVCTIHSCKTNEDNYRQAYEKVKEREAEKMPLDSTIYAEIRKQAHQAQEALAGDSVSIRHERVAVTEGRNPPVGTLRIYNVTAGCFKQKFHANSLRQRMIAGGYPESFIIQNLEPLYYVVVLSTDSPEEAVETLRGLEAESPVRLQEDYPIIIMPVR